MSHYRELFYSLEIGFCVIEVLFDSNKKPVDYRFLETNQAFIKQTGLTDVHGKTARELVPNLEEFWFDIYGKVALTGEPVHFENIAEEMGHYYDVYAYRFGNPEENKIAVLFNDVKEKKEVMDKLQKTEALYRNTLDNMIEGCAIIGYDWTFLYVNDTNAKHARLNREDMIGRKMTDLLPGVENSPFFSCYKRCMYEQIPQQIEDHYIFADGSEGWYQVIVQPVPEGIFLLSMEITKRKTAELKLNQTFKDLKLNEARLKQALKIAKMGHAEIEIETGKIFWSEEVFGIYERPLEAGPPTFSEALSYIHPDDREMVLSKVQNAASNGEFLELDYRIKLPGDRVKYLTYFMTPIMESGKQIKRIGTLQDITERKLYEIKLQQKISEKEILLKELYHRTKNNMQIVSSLLNIRGETISNEEDRNIFFKMKDHIRAMSLVHEKLYQSQNLSRINFGAYIKDISDSLMACYPEFTYRVQITYDIIDIEVLMDVALPCGFIITELIHNIFKYAFPEGRHGNIKICLGQTDSRIEIQVADDGVGMPASERESGNKLGLILVKTLVEQLEGEMILDDSNGTCWRIIVRDDLYKARI